MTCETDMLDILDLAANQGQFPTWAFDEHYTFTGAMRVSGFTSASGVGLVFEQVEYSVRERVIQCLAHCFGTLHVTKRLVVGDGVHVQYEDLINPETGKFSVDFGAFQAVSRGRIFTITLGKNDLISGEYLKTNAKALTPQALLFRLCDTVSSDWLFCEPDHLKRTFEMDPDAKRLFFIEEWQHLSIEEVYEDEIKPSSSPDIVAMVEALCSGDSSPKLVGTPNTSWRAQWLGKK